MKLPKFTRRNILTSRPSCEVEANGQIAIAAKVNLERVWRCCRINRQGAAAVEFALVAPLFFLLVFGMIEFGRAIMVQQILTNAAREGARVAVLDGSTITEVNNRVSEYLQRARLPVVTPTVTPNPTTAANGTPIYVTVQIPFSQVSWLPSPMFIAAGRQLSATAVMRRETVQ